MEFITYIWHYIDSQSLAVGNKPLWLTSFIIASGLTVSFVYLLFTAMIKKHLQKYIKGVFNNSFAFFLKGAFICSAIVHLLHSASYKYPIADYLLAIFYPLLLFFMIRFLVEGYKASKRIRYILNTDETMLAAENISLNDDNSELRDELVNAVNDRKRMHISLHRLIISDEFRKIDSPFIKEELKKIIS